MHASKLTYHAAPRTHEDVTRMTCQRARWQVHTYIRGATWRAAHTYSVQPARGTAQVHPDRIHAERGWGWSHSRVLRIPIAPDSCPRTCMLWGPSYVRAYKPGKFFARMYVAYKIRRTYRYITTCCIYTHINIYLVRTYEYIPAASRCMACMSMCTYLRASSERLLRRLDAFRAASRTCSFRASSLAFEIHTFH